METHVRLHVLVLEVESVLPNVNADERNMSYTRMPMSVLADVKVSDDTHRAADPGSLW